jgi:hypothetical protein
MQNPTNQAETSIPTETVREGPDVNQYRTFTVRRKAAKRSEPWYLAPPLPQNVAAALSIPPARKKPRITTSPDISVGLPPPPAADDDDPVTDTQPNTHSEAVRVTGLWTLQEETKLTSAVTKMCKKKEAKEHRIDWVAVAAIVPGRTTTQCRNKWHHALALKVDRSIGRKGSWTAHENNTLKKAIEMYGSKDWAAIVALVPGRTKQQCYDRWRKVLDPTLGTVNGTKGRWTSDEDNKLKHSVQMHGGNDWAVIAALVPGRTKRQCHKRWQNAYNHSIDRRNGHTGKWTEDEDLRLRNSVQIHGDKDWVAIASLVEDRTKIQCRHRWCDVLVPSIDRSNGRTGKWGEDEDLSLKNSVQIHGGKDWAAIATLVPGRTQKQCRNRWWYDVLDSSIGQSTGRTGKWGEDEDIKLKSAIQAHGDKHWAAIAALVLGRTQKQCSDRWRKYTDPNRSAVQGKTLGILNKAPALGRDPH